MDYWTDKETNRKYRQKKLEIYSFIIKLYFSVSCENDASVSKTVHFEFHNFEQNPDAFSLTYDDLTLDQVTCSH
jgi:hypothetical protein